MKSLLSRFLRLPLSVAVWNLLVVMAVYSLSRCFFYVVNGDLFAPTNFGHVCELMGGGLRFDLCAVLYLSAAYLVAILLPLPWRWRSNRVYQEVCRWVLLVPNLLGVVINCVDMVYVRFTDRRTTWGFFTEFANDGNLWKIFLSGVVEYWCVTLFFVAMCCLLVLGVRRVKDWKPIFRGWAYYMAEIVVFVLCGYLTVIGIRGGFGAYTRPITLSNALQYTDSPQEALVVLNTPFSLIRSVGVEVYSNPHYYDDDALENVMTPMHTCAMGEEMENRNVVVMILESFSKEYIGFFNDTLDGGEYHGYTPFLDSLCTHAVTYKCSFASGRKSIDAMPSVLSSIPMLITPYVLTPYSTNAVSSVADCLRKKGYTTAFFHGAPNGSMGFEAYAHSAGFERYYGMDEYDGLDAFDGTWAVWDEEFLQYYGRTMSKMKKPFCTAVFTASSHHPFRVPERYEGRFPKGDKAIHQCIGYSDNALRAFFNFAKQQPWYENTLFVLTADHTNELSHRVYRNAKGLFEVPVIFFDPRRNVGELREGPISQTDIMPSVLGYLGYDGSYFAFGEDALTREKVHPYAVCYNGGVYQIFSNRLLVSFDGVDVVGVYDFVKDPFLRYNRREELLKDAEVVDMLAYLKAYIQQYISRMIENRLTAD